MKHVGPPPPSQQQASSTSETSRRLRRTAYMLPVVKSGGADANIFARLSQTPSRTGMYHEPFYNPLKHNAENKHAESKHAAVVPLPTADNSSESDQDAGEPLSSPSVVDDRASDECIDRIELITVGIQGCDACALQQQLIEEADGSKYGLTYVDMTQNPHHEACAVPSSLYPYHVYCDGTGDDRVCTYLFDGVATVEEIFARAAALGDVMCSVD